MPVPIDPRAAAPQFNQRVQCLLCPEGLSLPSAGYGRSRLSRDGYRSLAAVTHAYEDRPGKTMPVAGRYVSMTKGRVDDVDTVGAKSFAFVTFMEDFHDLGWQLTCELMMVRSTQSCQDVMAEGAQRPDEITTLTNRNLLIAKGRHHLRGASPRSMDTPAASCCHGAIQGFYNRPTDAWPTLRSAPSLRPSMMAVGATPR